MPSVTETLIWKARLKTEFEVFGQQKYLGSKNWKGTDWPRMTSPSATCKLITYSIIPSTQIHLGFITSDFCGLETSPVVSSLCSTKSSNVNHYIYNSHNNFIPIELIGNSLSSTTTFPKNGEVIEAVKLLGMFCFEF